MTINERSINRSQMIPAGPRLTRTAPAIACGWCLALAAVHASAAPGTAQDMAVCRAGRISEIVVENQSVFDLSDPSRSGRFQWAYRLANKLHARTEEEVIEREMLVSVGDCLDVALLRDSERLLRSFDFLADAQVYEVGLPDGSIRIVVRTRDEWSTRIEPRIGSNGTLGLRGLRFVEDNLLGTGRHLALFYDHADEERVYGVRYRTPHFFDSRWNMGVELARTEVGYSYRESVAYPFVGEAGRVAFRQGIDRTDRYFEMFMPEGDDGLERIWIPVRREQFEVGAAVRWSRARYRHTLIAAAVAGERIGYPAMPRFAEADGQVVNAAVALGREWMPTSSVRLVLLTGQRNVWFVRQRAIDTINGVEDVQLGVEAEASIGPSLPLVSDDRDVSVGIGFFVAGQPGSATIVGGQFSFEGRRSYETVEGFPEWNDVLTELDVWGYFKQVPQSRHTVVATLSWVGGWHNRVPYQLTLGGDTGLRGYRKHVDPGGRRLVASLEHRTYVGSPFAELFDLGAVAFLDVGKIWPGHVALGTESPIRASLGVGLRAAFPPGSRQNLRLDVGLPADRGGLGDVTVSLGFGQAIGRQGSRRDPQLVRSARYGLATSDFVYPPSRP